MNIRVYSPIVAVLARVVPRSALRGICAVAQVLLTGRILLPASGDDRARNDTLVPGPVIVVRKPRAARHHKGSSSRSRFEAGFGPTCLVTSEEISGQRHDGYDRSTDDSQVALDDVKDIEVYSAPSCIAAVFRVEFEYQDSRKATAACASRESVYVLTLTREKSESYIKPTEKRARSPNFLYRSSDKRATTAIGSSKMAKSDTTLSISGTPTRTVPDVQWPPTMSSCGFMRSQ